MISTKLEKFVVSDILQKWFYYWNNNDLDNYMKLYSEDATVLSNCANYAIPESDGKITGKANLYKYWTILKKEFPSFIFDLNTFAIYDECFVFRYCLRSKKEIEIFARIYLDYNHKISKLEIAYFDSDFEKYK